MSSTHLWRKLISCIFMVLSTSASAQISDATGLAAVWTGPSELYDTQVGTAFHIGNGTFITAGHVIDNGQTQFHIVLGAPAENANRIDPVPGVKCVESADICFFQVNELNALVLNERLSLPFSVTCAANDADRSAAPWVTYGFAPESLTVKTVKKLHVKSWIGRVVRKDESIFEGAILADGGTSSGMSGSPFFDPATRAVIGVHIGYAKTSNDQVIYPFSGVSENVSLHNKTVFDPGSCTGPNAGRGTDSAADEALNRPLQYLAQTRIWEDFAKPDDVDSIATHDDVSKDTDNKALLASRLGGYVLTALIEEPLVPLDPQTQAVAEYFRTMGDPHAGFILALNDIYRHNHIAASVNLDTTLKAIDRWALAGWPVSIDRNLVDQLHQRLVEKNGFVVGNAEWRKVQSSFDRVFGAEAFPVYFPNLRTLLTRCVWDFEPYCPPEIAQALVASGLESQFVRVETDGRVATLVTENLNAILYFNRFTGSPTVSQGKTVFLESFLGWITRSPPFWETDRIAVLTALAADEFPKNLLLEPVDLYAPPLYWHDNLLRPTPFSLAVRFGDAELFSEIHSKVSVPSSYSERRVSLLDMLFLPETVESQEIPFGECYVSDFQESPFFDLQLSKLAAFGGRSAFDDRTIKETSDRLLWAFEDKGIHGATECYYCFYLMLNGEDCKSTELPPVTDAAASLGNAKNPAANLWNRDRGMAPLDVERTIATQAFAPYCWFSDADPIDQNKCQIPYPHGAMDLRVSEFSVTLEWSGDIQLKDLRTFAATYGGSGAEKLFEFGLRNSIALGRLHSEICVVEKLDASLSYHRKHLDVLPNFQLRVSNANTC